MVTFEETPGYLALRNERLALAISTARGEWLSFRCDGRELINHRSAPQVPVDFKVEGEWQVEKLGCRYLGCELQRDERGATLLARLGVGELPPNFAAPASLMGMAPRAEAQIPATLSQLPRGRPEYVVTCAYRLGGETELRRWLTVQRNQDVNLSHIRTLRFEAFLFKLPGVIVGLEESCTVDMPGPIVAGSALRPRLPYAEAKALYYYRRTAPDFDLGVVLVDNPSLPLTLAEWHESVERPYNFHLCGDGAGVTLAHNEEFANFLLDGGSFTSRQAVIRLGDDGIPGALRAYAAYIQRVAPPMNNAPAWVKDAVLLEVDTAYYGGFEGLRRALPGLREAGFNTLYLLPVNEGGYGVADPYSIDPALGSAAEFKALVAEAHRLGVRVLMDLLIVIVKRDAKLVQEHPEYFQRDEAGRILPHFKWGNAAADHGHPGFRRYITDFAAYCVREYGVDGFRVDAASATTPNWYPHSGRAPWQTVMGSYSLMEEVNRAIKAVNPEAILLDELGGPVFFHVSDICHNFGFVHQLTWPENKAAGYTAWHYQRLLSDMQDALPDEALRVFYTRNHDSAWFTRSFEYSPEFFSYEAIHCLVRGVPLMFGGQARWPGPDEAAMAFYRQLFALRRVQPALVEGECLYCAAEVDSQQVFAVVRRLGKEALLCLVSTAGEPLSLRVRLVEPGLEVRPGPRRLPDLFAGRDVEVESAADFGLTLEPYAVRVLRL